MIQALERAAKILRLTAEKGRKGIRLCDLSRAAGMKRNTVYNLAETLVKEALLAKSQEGTYVIGEEIRNLAGKHRQEEYLSVIENALSRLHSDYPASSIIYSELGDVNISVVMHFLSTAPGNAVHPGGSVLNPYLTVAGLVFFAFAGEGRLDNITGHNPFEYTGVNVWGSMNKFMAYVDSVAEKGYAETPDLIPETAMKIGVPVFRQPGDMAGAITFHLKNAVGLNRKAVLRDVLDTARELGYACY